MNWDWCRTKKRWTKKWDTEQHGRASFRFWSHETRDTQVKNATVHISFSFLIFCKYPQTSRKLQYQLLSPLISPSSVALNTHHFPNTSWEMKLSHIALCWWFHPTTYSSCTQSSPAIYKKDLLCVLPFPAQGCSSPALVTLLLLLHW